MVIFHVYFISLLRLVFFVGCVCVCWCLFLYLCVWQGVGGICGWKCICMQSQRSALVSFPRCYLPWFLRQGFSLCLELADWAKSACQQATGILLSLPPQYWDYKDAQPCPAYFWHEFWRSNSGPPFLKVSIIGRVSPALIHLWSRRCVLW